MLTADFIDSITQPVVDIYERLDFWLLKSILTQTLGGITEQNIGEIKYKIKRYADLGLLSKITAVKIDEATVKAERATRILIRDAIIQALKTNGIGTKLTGGVDRVMQAVLLQAQDDLNLVNTVMKAGALDKATGMLELLTAEQHGMLSTGAMQAATGATTMTDAIKQTIHSIADHGINAFRDRAGRYWSAEGYVAMDLRTTAHNAALSAVKAQGEDLGLSVILVSSHPGARPQCAPYQGKCYSFNGTSGTIYDARGRKYTYEPIERTSYKKEPAGLFGINCGHSFRYIQDGAFINREETTETQAEERQNIELYANKQTARSMERKVRKYKREAELMGVFSEEEKTHYNNLAWKWEQVYADFCDSNGIHQMPDRLKIL